MADGANTPLCRGSWDRFHGIARKKNTAFDKPGAKTPGFF